MPPKVFDHCRQNNYLPLTILRKIFTGLGMIIPAICMASLHLLKEKDIIGYNFDGYGVFGATFLIDLLSFQKQVFKGNLRV